MCTFWSRYIKNFDLIIKDLRCLTLKDSPWKSGELPESARNAFFQLRNVLSSRPLLIHPDFGKRFYVFVDAATGNDSGMPSGIGAMLAQLDDFGNYRPISFISRGLKGSEKNYSPFIAEKLAITWALEKWRYYLIGNQFTLFSDNKPCTKLSEKQSTTFCRLQEKMLEFDFDIKYLQSKENTVADALSRSVIDAVAVEIDHADLPGLQSIDDDIFSVRRFIESNQSSNVPKHLEKFAKRCVVKNGVVWVKDNRFNLQNERLVFWPPRKVVNSLIHQYHATTLMGHRGATATKVRLRDKFLWPNFYDDIDAFISSCSICQRTQQVSSSKLPLIPYLPPKGPCERVSMDLFTGIPAGDGNKMNIITFVDDYSKYLEIAVIKDKTALSVADAFFQTWICRHGVPSSIRSDFGREFRNAVFDRLAERLNIERCKLTSLSPASNGQAENVNRILVRAFQRMEPFEPSEWIPRLEAIRMAYNCAYHRAHGFTPYYIVHGRCPRLGNFDPTAENEQPSDIPSSVAEFVDKLVSNLTSSYADINENLKINADKMKKQADKNAKDYDFKEKDFVLLHYPKISQKGPYIKSNKCWLGPFRIEKKSGRQMFVISAPGRTTQEVHGNRLKRFNFGIDEWDEHVGSPLEADVHDELHLIAEDEFKAWNDASSVDKTKGKGKPKPKQTNKMASKKKPKNMSPTILLPTHEDPTDADSEDSDPETRSSSGEDDDDDDDDDIRYNNVHMRSLNNSRPATRSRGPVQTHPWVLPRALERKEKRKRVIHDEDEQDPDDDINNDNILDARRPRLEDTNTSVDPHTGNFDDSTVSGVAELEETVSESDSFPSASSNRQVDQIDAAKFKKFLKDIVCKFENRPKPTYAAVLKASAPWRFNITY